MKLKRFKVVVITLCSIFVLALSLVSAAERTLTYPLNVSANGTSASLETTCTYVDSGSTRWKNYRYYNYSVTNSNTHNFAMIASETKWVQGGSDSLGYHTNTFHFAYKTYVKGDIAQNPVTKTTKKIQYKYTASDNGYRASLAS